MLSKKLDKYPTPQNQNVKHDHMYPEKFKQKIALSGANSFLGHLLLQKLLSVPAVHAIHVFDIKPPALLSSKIHFHRLDLASEGADLRMAEVLQHNGVEAFIHGALFYSPKRNASYQKEVESIGTFHVLNAVAESSVDQLMVLSSTFVYGAKPSHPNFLNEQHPISSNGPKFVRIRWDVETQIVEFAKDYKDKTVTILRFAPIVGPNTSNVRANYFLAGVIPKVLGYDPLLQFIHEDDAVRAAYIAFQKQTSGVFNIVGGGVLSLSTAIHMAGKLPIPFAKPLCCAAFQLGYLFRIWDLSPEMVSFFQYVCIADGRKAYKILGFEPRFSSRQALRAMLEAHKLKNSGFGSPSIGFGEDNLGYEKTSELTNHS